MRLTRLGLRNLRRNPRRTLFTAASLAVSLFLFAALVSVVTSLEQSIDLAAKRPVAVVLHRSGFTHLLPESYLAKIRQVQGVREVIGTLYYGGHYGATDGPQDRFPSIGADTRPALRTFWGPDFNVDDAAWTAYERDRTAALAGPQLMRRYGWKAGQRITLHGTIWPVDLSFTVVGSAWFRTDQSTFLLHREYLDEALGHPGMLTLIWIQVDDVASLPAVASRIDALFAQSPDPVRTVSHKQLIITFLGMLGDIRGLVSMIALLVVIAVLFVTANSIALSARERTVEVAVLRALGFSGHDILVAMLLEATVMTACGGLCGSLVAWALFRTHAFSLGFGPLSGFQVEPRIVAIGLLAAVAVGVLAALLPALQAVRKNPVDGLRGVG